MWYPHRSQVGWMLSNQIEQQRSSIPRFITTLALNRPDVALPHTVTSLGCQLTGAPVGTNA
jgi:hypothetical protein